MADKDEFIPEEIFIPGKRLGRHIEHDPRSRAYKVVKIIPFEELKTVVHHRLGKTFDQGELGACTGMATAGVCNTLPTHIPHRRLLFEKDAINIYSKATAIDAFDGEYPPDDTGSSGLAACKAAQALKLITSYEHSFSIDQAISALQDRPLITGIPWMESMDNPDEDGVVIPGGEMRGGHEIQVIGFHLHGDTLSGCYVEFENSWGAKWGHNGRFFMTVAEWDKLLENDGDVTIPIRK
jgi:hypothetical protein